MPLQVTKTLCFLFDFIQPITSAWLTHETVMGERRQRKYCGNHRKQEAPFDIQNKCRGMRGSMTVK